MSPTPQWVKCHRDEKLIHCDVWVGNLVYKAAVVTIIKLVLLKPHLRRGITFNAFIIIIGGLGPLHRLKQEDYHIIKE